MQPSFETKMPMNVYSHCVVVYSCMSSWQMKKKKKMNLSSPRYRSTITVLTQWDPVTPYGDNEYRSLSSLVQVFRKWLATILANRSENLLICTCWQRESIVRMTGKRHLPFSFITAIMEQSSMFQFILGNQMICTVIFIAQNIHHWNKNKTDLYLSRCW